MLQAERDREELEEAQRSADESRRLAEEAASLEKAERQLKACKFYVNLLLHASHYLSVNHVILLFNVD